MDTLKGTVKIHQYRPFQLYVALIALCALAALTVPGTAFRFLALAVELFVIVWYFRRFRHDTSSNDYKGTIAAVGQEEGYATFRTTEHGSRVFYMHHANGTVPAPGTQVKFRARLSSGLQRWDVSFIEVA